MRIALAVSAIGISGQALAQEKFEAKVSSFLGTQHFMTQWLAKWSEKLEKASGGRLAFKQFPGAQMGPPPAQ
jgi:TRAP-type C4-dicarboxylate transport system substrate-binding protein